MTVSSGSSGSLAGCLVGPIAAQGEIRMRVGRVIEAPMHSPLDVDALVSRYGAMVLRRCRQLLKDEDEAMDVCQDVFVKMVERRDRLDASHPSSLLYVTATNLCLNRIRDRARHAVPTEAGHLERIAVAQDAGAGSDARLLLDRLFRRHPASSRTIAVLHYLDGFTLEQVAAEVGLSVSGVRKRLRSLRHVLKEMTT